MKISFEDTVSKLPALPPSSGTGCPWDLEVLRNRNITVRLFSPRESDNHATHAFDELYFIIRGSGVFRKNEYRYTFQKGDLLVVPANTVHVFESFSEDFAAWAIFLE